MERIRLIGLDSPPARELRYYIAQGVVYDGDEWALVLACSTPDEVVSIVLQKFAWDWGEKDLNKVARQIAINRMYDCGHTLPTDVSYKDVEHVAQEMSQ